MLNDGSQHNRLHWITYHVGAVAATALKGFLLSTAVNFLLSRYGLPDFTLFQGIVFVILLESAYINTWNRGNVGGVYAAQVDIINNTYALALVSLCIYLGK